MPVVVPKKSYRLLRAANILFNVSKEIAIAKPDDWANLLFV